MNEMSKIIRNVTNLIYGFAIIFGFYIIMHGHLTPGGGFQGGAVVASAFALLLISYGRVNTKKYLNKNNLVLLESAGLTMFIVVAFLGLGTTFFYNFLANSGGLFGNMVLTGINSGDMNTAGVLPLMNIAVGLEVFAGLGIVVLLMADGAEYTKKKENAEDDR